MFKFKDRKNEQQAICPYCSEPMGNNLEFDCNNETTCRCRMCDEYFIVERNTKYSYTSKGGEL